MEHLGTIKLTSDRLLLRRFTYADVEAMYKNWANDDEVTRYLTWTSHGSEQFTEKIIRLWVDSYQEVTAYSWAICLKSDSNQPIGSIALGNIDDRLEAMEIGYALGKNWWHQGYMSEALERVIQFAFENIGINRLVGHHAVANLHSGLVMKKCGMQYEGRIREAGFDNQGQRVDLVQYSLLAKDLEILNF